MKVLLCAPHTNLLMVDAEVQDVLTSGLDVVQLIGDVSSVDLTRSLRGHHYDVLWLATHGDKTGVLLTDGILSASTITQLVRGKIDLVFINTCSSYAVAQMIQNETGATVVCTVQEVPDGEAYRTASLFATALAETEPLVAESLEAGASPTLVADDQRAYLSAPTERRLYEIDYADGARIARTFDTATEPAFTAETGR